MKPEVLQDFLGQRGGVQECTARIALVALDFVRLVRSAYSETGNLLGEMDLSKSPECQGLLFKALETGEYEEVEQYISNALGLQPSPEASREQEATPVDNEASLATAFEGEYVPGAEVAFCEYLERCNEAFKNSLESYYAKFCSIVQSSGTGKSRMLIELKEQGVIVVYMNIRGTKERNAYPARDKRPADILTSNLECSEEEYTGRSVVFFTGLFITLKDRLEMYAKLHGSREEVIKAWSSDMCRIGSQARIEFFEELQGHYDKALEQILLQRSKRSKRKKTLEEPPGPQLPGGSAMTQAYEELVSMNFLFDNRGNAPQLVIAIDEAQLLRQLQDTYLPSHVLCRVISVFSKSQKEVSNWVVFASTTSEVADFSAPAHIHASLRIHEGGLLLFPPYSLLDWDQKAPALSDVNLENVAQFGHLVKFGRPL
ncbi:hypothetical protein FRC08_010225 [Ceratobasidium sp. 394]|nr:hypothetical protein FRC08_010225 [Ceratobasidium sp. 394]